MILKILISSLLAVSAFSAFSAFADAMYIHRSKDGQILLSNQKSNPFDKYSQPVKIVNYKDSSQATTNLNHANINILSRDNILDVTTSRTKSEIVTDASKYSLSGFEVPHGYRLPTKADMIGDWKRFDTPNHLKADFNGDGIEDEAYILPKKGSNGGYGVFVSINKSKTALQRGHKFQMFKLTDSVDMSPQSFFIDLAEPSNEIWESACGKGYWKCATGELNRPGIVGDLTF